ncbi:MAG: family 10 glycosylhydrolase, partial [Planctomycetota bacterium]
VWSNPPVNRAVPRSQAWVSSAPQVEVRHGEQLWFDPSSPVVQQRVHDEIVDVVERYDVDGVHIDDYFYPYPKPRVRFDDDASYQLYRRSGGRLSRSAWRRNHVNGFVAGLDRAIHLSKPAVKFGVSPFGIVRPGVPEGIQAGVDQYEDLAADVQTWLREGIVDYIVPQLYWPIAQRAQNYPQLLGWWSSVTPRDVHLFVGNFATKAWQREPGWSLRELQEQIQRTQRDPVASGTVLFSAKVLRDAAFRRGLRDRVWPSLALVPPSSWLDDDPPSQPDLDVRDVEGNLELRWTGDRSTRFWSVYLQRSDGDWQLSDVKGAAKPGLRIPASTRRTLGIRAVAVASIDQAGNESPYRVVSVSR